MSNFEEKFNNWRIKMNQKSEKERHAYAITVSFVITFIVLFFVGSNWYFQITGGNLRSSFFTDIEQMYREQKESFNSAKDSFSAQKDDFVDFFQMNKQVSATSTE